MKVDIFSEKKMICGYLDREKHQATDILQAKKQSKL